MLWVDEQSPHKHLFNYLVLIQDLILEELKIQGLGGKAVSRYISGTYIDRDRDIIDIHNYKRWAFLGGFK